MKKVVLPPAVICACLLALTTLQRSGPALPPGHVQFVDMARRAHLTMMGVNGGDKTKKYIWESTGSGLAAIDYDNDGYPDLFILNGSTLEGFPEGRAPTNHLYHNNGDGTFSDVTARSGLGRSGWAHGVCAGDYENDGYEDLFVTFYGAPNSLTITMVTGRSPTSLNSPASMVRGSIGVQVAHSSITTGTGSWTFS